MRVDLLDGLVEGIATALADRVVQALATAPVTTTPASEWRLLTTDEVSTALGRSTRWVREKARSGALPFIQLDCGPPAFHMEDVQAFASSLAPSGRSPWGRCWCPRCVSTACGAGSKPRPTSSSRTRTAARSTGTTW